MCKRTICLDLWIRHEKKLLSLMNEINVFSPQAWDSRIMNKSWQVQVSHHVTHLMRGLRTERRVLKAKIFTKSTVEPCSCYLICNMNLTIFMGWLHVGRLIFHYWLMYFTGQPHITVFTSSPKNSVIPLQLHFIIVSAPGWSTLLNTLTRHWIKINVKRDNIKFTCTQL